MLKVNSFKNTIFFGFVLATFLPLIFFGFFSYFYLSSKIEESGNQRNELLANTVAIEISSYLSKPEVVLHQTDIHLSEAIHDDDTINALLNEVVEDSYYLETLYLIDKNKQVVNIGLEEEFVHLAKLHVGNDLSGMSILRNIGYINELLWSNSFHSPVTGRKSIALIYPAQNFYLIGLINISFLHRVIKTHSDKKGISTIILDEYGNLVFHPELKIVEEQQNFAHIRPFREAQGATFGTFSFNLKEDIYIGSTAEIGQTKWLVMTIQSLGESQLAVHNLAKFFVIAVVISLIVISTLALRQAKKLLKPLQDLQQNIQAVAEGDYEDKISIQPLDEFEKVAEHFRDMATAIARREQLLEVNEERLLSLLEIHNLKQLTEDEILEFAVEQAVLLTRSQLGYIRLLDKDNTATQKIIWSRDLDDFCRNLAISVPEIEGDDHWLKCIRDRQHTINNLQKKKDNAQPGALQIALHRQLNVPILDNNTIVLVIGVFNKQGDYDHADARQLSLYFNHIWDIILQKRSEKEKSRLAEQLAHAQKLEAIGTLAGGIAHDFNNVLMVIVGNTEMAKDNIGKPEKLQHDLNEIFKASLRARDLVNQILAFSRHNTEGLKPLDIRPIVNEAVKLLRSSIPANIEIRHDISKESQRVISEPGQINQLLMNLCTNAYQAMEKKSGILEIGLSPVNLENDLYSRGKMVATLGSYMLLTVSDTGSGIPEEMINRIFEPYYTTREKEQGTGLGLAVVHGIVKGLNGAITVESKIGEGTTFNIYLPVEKTESTEEELIVSGNLPGGDEHILYVDDDRAVAEVNSKILVSLGYEVTTFNSSREALNAYSENQHSYDLVISDMTMPEITGDLFTRKLLEINNEVLVILLTGYSEDIDEEKAAQIGARELLMKPLTKFDLALTVRKVLGFKTSSF